MTRAGKARVLAASILIVLMAIFLAGLTGIAVAMPIADPLVLKFEPEMHEADADFGGSLAKG